MRVYFTTNNPFIFTKCDYLKNYDPGEMMTTHRYLNNTYLALISHSKNLYR